ncbi:uncharacterized protein PG998_006673 [Apiospora kogelbergensis]|uniref:uncharacterized protein n=1 Tax=Apiospora kogelbergensis TaxID=1337665 RepID=UPI00312F397E
MTYKIRAGTALDGCVTSEDRRVYMQDEDDYIIEFIYKDGQWNSGTQIVQAAPGAGIAAVWWDQLGRASSGICLYYLNKDFVLCEKNLDLYKENKWYDGGLVNKGWKLYPTSQISAKIQQMSRTHKTDLRMFVVGQMEDGTIQAYLYRGGEWSLVKGWDFGKGHPGTCLTVCEHKYENRVFYQAPDLRIVEMTPPSSTGAWTTTTIIPKAPAGSAIASYQVESLKPNLFYVRPEEHTIAWHMATGHGNWNAGSLNKKIAEGSKFTSWRRDGVVYSYVQTAENPSKVTEWTGTNWKETAVLPSNA